MIERYLGKEASEFIVVGLMVTKAEVDTFSGYTTLEITSRLGTIKKPLKFLPFLEQAQLERKLLSA